MRWLSSVLCVVSVLGVVGCGGDDAVHHQPDAPIAPDAAMAECTTAACMQVKTQLSGLRWELPCGADNDSRSCFTNAAMTSMAVPGTAGTMYTLQIHLRGVVELKTISGGTTTDLWNVGGTPGADGYNVYKLAISAPDQTYYLNTGGSGIANSFPVDYAETIEAAAGAIVTLTADPLDGIEIKNIDGTNLMPISITGTQVPQPYNGQFIEMQVESIATP